MTPVMTSRPFNFSAGPATMPAEVLAQAADEMLDWPDSSGKRCGMGVMEMSHRGKEFLEIYTQAHVTLRELLAIPTNFKVLFMQGGGLAENAIVPMNLSALRASKTQRGSADFVITGSWSEKSFQEAGKYCDSRIAASGRASGPSPATCEALSPGLLHVIAKHSRRFDAPSSKTLTVRHSKRPSALTIALKSATEPPHPK